MSALTDALGRRAVAKLSEVAGGRTLRIPHFADHRDSAAARTRLIALVGLDLATDLITALAGSRVYVPRGPSEHNSRTRPIDARAVGKLTKRGMSAATIADRLGCTERTVHAKRTQLARKRRNP